MVSLIAIAAAIICSFMTCNAAKIYPPRTCDRDNVKNCVALFDKAYAQADTNDLQSQCELVLHEGAKCYAPCPQVELTRFIEEYDNGRCKDYRPSHNRRRSGHDSSLDVPQIRNEELEWQVKRRPKLPFAENAIPELTVGSSLSALSSLKITLGGSSTTTETDNGLNHGDARSYGSKTVTVTRATAPEAQPSTVGMQGLVGKPTTDTPPASVDACQSTTAVDPGEYHSRLQKSRYKENLRSVRSRQAQESAEAEARSKEREAILEHTPANKAILKATISKQSSTRSDTIHEPTTSTLQSKSSAARIGFSISLVALVLVLQFL